MWVVSNMARSCRSASCQSLLPRSSDKPGWIFLLAGKDATLISAELDANSSSQGENTGLFSLRRSPRPPLWVRTHRPRPPLAALSHLIAAAVATLSLRDARPVTDPPGPLQVLGGALRPGAVVISLSVNLH